MTTTLALDPRREWREMMATFAGIAAMTLYGAVGPSSVRLVSLPVSSADGPRFGPEYWAWFFVPFFIACFAPMLATAIARRQLPSLRASLGRPKVIAVSLALAIAFFLVVAYALPRPTRGLEALDEHTGAYVWASADLASNAVGFLGFSGIVFAVIRMLEGRRASRALTHGDPVALASHVGS
jgi:hypothetical protein